MGMFTPEELEELRRFDEMVDREKLSYEDYVLEDLVDDILFPHEAAKRAKRAAARKARREKKTREELHREYREDYAKRDKEAERARKREWYKKNRDRVRAQQKAYSAGRRKKTGDTVPA